jgi:hypothetical protein
MTRTLWATAITALGLPRRRARGGAVGSAYRRASCLGRSGVDVNPSVTWRYDQGFRTRFAVLAGLTQPDATSRQTTTPIPAKPIPNASPESTKNALRPGTRPTGPASVEHSSSPSTQPGKRPARQAR